MSIGTIGERLAARYLREQGFDIREENMGGKQGEIDLVAYKDGVLHFVEVKTKSVEFFEEIAPEDKYIPEDGGGDYVRKTAEVYARAKGIGRWQIDSIAVFIETKTKKVKVEVIENIAQ